MSRASSHALKHPPVTAPSEPAGATPFPELQVFPELDVAVERKRRRGRGAQSNDSGRYEAEARVAFDDGWQTLEDLPPFKTTVALDTSRKVIARNDSPDIGFDRSINPYRGCEHGCVYCFARPTSGRHRHQVGAGDARHRHSPADGETQSGQGRSVGDNARSKTRAHHGAAGIDATEAAGSDTTTGGSRHSRNRDGRTCHPRAERFRDRAHSRCRRPRRREGGELRAAAAAA